MKKGIIILLALMLIGIAVPALAAEESTAKKIWEGIVYVFALQWLVGANPDITILAFARLVLVLIVFFTIFELFSHAPVLKDITEKSKRSAFVASLAISVLVGVFLPAPIIMTIALTYSGFFGFILVAIPTAIAIWLAYSFEPETRSGYLIRLVLLLLAFWMVGVAEESTEKWVREGVRSPLLSSATGTRIIESLDTFSTWALWIIGIAIGLNALNMLGNFPERAGEAAREHGRGFFSSIGEALGKRKERFTGRAAKGAEFGFKEMRALETTLNQLQKQNLPNVLSNIQATYITSPVQAAATGPAIVNLLTGTGSGENMLRTIEGIEGYDAVVNAGELTGALRSGFTAAMAAANTLDNTVGDNAHEAMKAILRSVRELLQRVNWAAIAVATASNRSTLFTLYSTNIKYVQTLARALLAHNKLRVK